jgi:8-oxo-dGTP pyrophosphatase MutT (NUDIX family)
VNAMSQVVTARAYVCIGHLMPFMVGPTLDGRRLAVIRLGGHREDGETPCQCAAREVVHEASLILTDQSPPATFW